MRGSDPRRPGLRWPGVLAARNFRFQFLARSTSLLGDYVAQIAVAFAVLQATGSTSGLGFVLAARTVPLVVFVLAGGVWADRLPRQRVMLTADIVSLGAQGTLAALVLAGHVRLWHFVVLQLLLGTALAFFRPASTGLTPRTAPADQLPQANALLSLSQNVMSVGGPALGGVLVAVVGPGAALAVDAATFGLSAIFLSLVRLELGAAYAAGASFFHELAAGWTEVVSRSWIRTAIVSFSLFQVAALSTFFVLGPTVAQQRLNGAGSWSAIVAVSGIGSMLGGAAALRWRPRRPLVVCFVGLAAWALPLLALALGASVVTVAAAALPAGFGLSLGGTLWETVLQSRVPDRALSRVSAYDWMGSTALRPAGFVAVGPLVATIGIRATLTAAAVTVVAISAATLTVREVRTMASD